MNSLRDQQLIVFGCGYVGSVVAAQAQDRGMKVGVLTRNPQKAAALRAQGLEVVVADLASDEWHHSFSGDVDFVLNAVSSGGGGLEGYRRSYVAGMQSILRWASTSAHIGTLVYTSSTSVYPQDGGVVVNEVASTQGAGELPRVLLEAENLLRDFVSHPLSKNALARMFILRLAGIYGPDREHLVEQVRRGTVSGKTENRLNLAHRDDIAAAIWSAFNAGPAIEDGIFNVADDGAAAKGEIVNWLAAEIGVPAPVFTGAPVAGRRAITPDRIIDNAKLKAVLGWKPQYPTFREGYKNRVALDSE
ncbi:MAG: NAD-dependent epimerase/dehydratase family protein [Opitutus sp.]